VEQGGKRLQYRNRKW